MVNALIGKITLRSLRNNYHLTQDEMAQKVGVSREAWSNYERGLTIPNGKNLLKIERTFNVSFQDDIELIIKNKSD